MDTLSLYDRDFYAWTQEQVRLLKEGALEELDLMHISDEVESMGSSEIRELERRMEILLMHLLKWEYQPNLQCNSWRYTIKEQRKRIALRLKKMPSLKSKLSEIFLESYEIAIYEAVKETGLSEEVFPINCEWSIKQVLDDEFIPG